jgi:hypothetical protein
VGGRHRFGGQPAPGMVPESNRRKGTGARFERWGGMSWTPVESSAFWAAGYAKEKNLLCLLFRSGEVYCYFDVPCWQ